MSSIIPESLPEFLLGTLSAFLALIGLSNSKFNKFQNNIITRMEKDREQLIREMDLKYASLASITAIEASLISIQKDLAYLTKDIRDK